jgi:hypothetical protein
MRPKCKKKGGRASVCMYPAQISMDKSTIIAQQFCPGGCSSWCTAVKIKDNSLGIEHRSSCGGATEETVVADVEKDTGTM